jgi:hypothetical protein
LRFEALAFDGLTAIGGVRVAVGDLTGDGQPDVLAASGNGISTRVRIFNGRTGEAVSDFLPYGTGFTRGAFVAVGDVHANPGNEIIVAPNKGKQPVKVFDAAGGELASFFAFGANFKKGVRVAAGDTDGNAGDDIIAAKGAGNGQVRVFDGAGLELLRFRPFGSLGAVFISAGDVDGDGQVEIVAARDKPFGAKVRIFDGATGALESQFTAYAGFKGGVRLGVLPSGDRHTILTEPGAGLGPDVKLFDGLTLAELDSFFAYDPSFTGGIFVAGG